MMSNFFIKNKISLILLLVSCIFIWSCNKHTDQPEPDVDLSLEQDFMTIFADLNSAQGNIDSAFYIKSGTCATIDTVSYPSNAAKKYLLYTIHFNGVNCYDTLKRSGKIEIYHSGNYLDTTLRDSVVFKDFTIGDRTIRGNRIIVNGDFVPQFRNLIMYDRDTISFLSGKTYTLQSTPLRWSEDITSKITSIYGGFSGISYNSEKFSVSIAAATLTPPTHLTGFPLKYDWNCSDISKMRYPVSGAFVFTNSSQNLIRTINFEKATLIYNADPTIKQYSWEVSTCGRDTATYISPQGNAYYFNVK